MLLASILVFALTRAEIIERMRAPVLTQSDGLVQVFADCPEDLRREFQSPIARFAADTVANAYRGSRMRPLRFHSPGIIIHIGSVRTNAVDIFSRVTTNSDAIVSRIYVKSPARADLDRLRVEVLKGFFRAVKTNEVADAEAVRIYRSGDPELRIADERQELEDWYAGKKTSLSDEDALKRIRRVIEPGFASRRDVRTFASRLYFYPPEYDAPFAGLFRCLAFREAVKYARIDPRIRLMAIGKSQELIIFGGGRGEALSDASKAYALFLIELSRPEADPEKLRDLLEQADAKLALAMEKAK